RLGAVTGGTLPSRNAPNRIAAHRRSSSRWRNMPGQMSPARTMLCGNSRPNPRLSTAGYRWEVFLLVPFQTSSAPHIAIGNEDRDNENAHLDKTEPAKQVEFNRKRVQEDDLNIEDDEQHRD